MKRIRIAAALAVVALLLMGCGSPSGAAAPPTAIAPAPPSPNSARPSVRPTSADEVPRMTIEELSDRMAHQENLVVVDVRGTEAYAEGHIPGALDIPYSSVVAQSGGWSKTDTTIVLYCS